MDKQVFLDFIIRFNLRQCKQNKPTLIYAVFCFDRKQYKISTGLKIYPSQWNREKQIATISNGQTQLDNRNNAIINRRLIAILTKVEEKKGYLCENVDSISNIFQEIKFVINPNSRNMVRQVKQVATTILSQMIEKYIEPKSQSLYIHSISSFKKFLKEKGFEDNLASLDVDLLTTYQEYLCEKRLQFKTIHNYEGAIITLIYKANKDRDIKANINLTGYERIQDMRSKEQRKSKQVPLTEAQLLSIYHLTNLSQEDEEARDLFLCQSLLGQRISDMPKIFKGEYIVSSLRSGDEVISFNVQKTGEEAVLYLFPIAMEIILKYRNKGLKFYNILSDDEKIIKRAENKLNQSIKRICRKANLDSDINYTEQIGKKIVSKKTKLYKLIHTHIARHTFITLMCKFGVPKDNVIIATAHTDEKMINDVYLHETVDDKGKRLVESIRNIKGSVLFQLKSTPNPIQEKSESSANSNFNYEAMKADILAKKELEETTEKQANNIQTLKQMLAIEKHEEEAQNSRLREMEKAFKAGIDYDTFLEIQAEQNEIAGLADEADQIDIFDNHQKP